MRMHPEPIQLGRKHWGAAALGAALFASSAVAQTVLTLAGGHPGNPNSPFYGYRDKVVSTNATFNLPSSTALDSQGTLYVADSGNHAIRQMWTPTSLIDGFTSTLLKFTNRTPVGVAINEADVLYILTSEDAALRTYDLSAARFLSTNTFSSAPTAITLARDGSGTAFLTLSNGTVCSVSQGGATRTLATQFKKPAGIAWTPSGMLAVSDAGNNSIWWVDSQTGATYWLSGITNSPGGFADGTYHVAQFNQPSGLAAAGNGTLLVADRLNNRVRLVYSDGYAQTLYGIDSSLWTNNGWCDSIYGPAEARSPASVTVSPEGVVFVTELYYDLVREVTGSGFSSTIPAPTTPSFTPDCGYFVTPMQITVSNSIGYVHYTVDGTDPTPSSTYLPTPGGVGIINWFDTNRDLSSLRVKAFYGTNVSDTVAGQICQPTTPTFSPVSGFYPNGRIVIVKNSVGVVFYTTNNTEPTIRSSYVPMHNGVGYIYWTNALHDLSWLRVKAFNAVDPQDTNNFSPTVRGQLLLVTTPTFSPTCGFYNGPISVINSIGDVYYTTDGTEPSLSSPHLDMSAGFNTLDWNSTSSLGSLRLKAFGSVDNFSPTVSGQAYCSPTTPSFSPLCGYFPQGQTILVSNAFGDVYYTTNATEPTTNNLLVAMTNGFGVIQWTNALHDLSWLRLKAFSGNLFSPTVDGEVCQVTTPTFTPSCGFYTNPVDITVINLSGDVYYTTDGSEPVFNGLQVNMAGGVGIIHWTNITQDLSALRLKAFSGPNNFSPTAGGETCPPTTPTFSPLSGYFPSGTTIWVTNEIGAVHYTTDGTEPTANSPAATRLANGLASIRWFDALHDLSFLRLKAFSGTNVSPTVSGQAVQVNSIGVPRDLVAGIGSSVVIPVVVTLTPGQQLRSLQFRFEVVPSSPGASPVSGFIQGLNITTNDFVPVVVGSSDSQGASFHWATYRNGEIDGIEYDSIATNLSINSFGVVANFMITLPPDGIEGDTYSVNVLAASGTSDAAQNSISLALLPPATLTVSNVFYLAGDCSPGVWYNAEDFGNGFLDNADVNAAFLASMGVHTPYPFTDAFNAMDVYPETSSIIGDGMITFLDWQHILQRSLGLETNNWMRGWGPGGALTHYRVGASNSSATVNSLIKPALVSAAPPAWVRHALIAVGTVTNLSLAPSARCPFTPMCSRASTWPGCSSGRR